MIAGYLNLLSHKTVNSSWKLVGYKASVEFDLNYDPGCPTDIFNCSLGNPNKFEDSHFKMSYFINHKKYWFGEN